MKLKEIDASEYSGASESSLSNQKDVAMDQEQIQAIEEEEDLPDESSLTELSSKVHHYLKRAGSPVQSLLFKRQSNSISLITKGEEEKDKGLERDTSVGCLEIPTEPEPVFQAVRSPRLNRNRFEDSSSGKNKKKPAHKTLKTCKTMRGETEPVGFYQDEDRDFVPSSPVHSKLKGALTTTKAVAFDYHNRLFNHKTVDKMTATVYSGHSKLVGKAMGTSNLAGNVH